MALYLIDRHTQAIVEYYEDTDYWEFLDTRWGGVYPFVAWSSNPPYCYISRIRGEMRGVMDCSKIWSPTPEVPESVIGRSRPVRERIKEFL